MGLCQWKDDLLWSQGKIWIPNDERIRTTLIAKHHDSPQAGHGGTSAKCKNHSWSTKGGYGPPGPPDRP